jgi:hypothetical protein
VLVIDDAIISRSLSPSFNSCIKIIGEKIIGEPIALAVTFRLDALGVQCIH